MSTKFKVVRNPMAGHECCVLCGKFYHISGIEVEIYEGNEPCGTICPECREADQETRRNRILKYVAQELENIRIRIQWANTKLKIPNKDEIEVFAKRLKKEE